MKIWKWLIGIFFIFFLVGCAQKQLKVSDAWARAALVGSNTAVYMKIDNQTAEDDYLLKASCDAAAAVELHESKMDANGMMQMSPQENILVSANSVTELKPGGLHVMLIGLTKDLRDGDVVKVELEFKKAGKMIIEVPVKTADAMPMK
jgi:copper(I)-binding protein